MNTRGKLGIATAGYMTDALKGLSVQVYLLYCLAEDRSE